MKKLLTIPALILALGGSVQTHAEDIGDMAMKVLTGVSENAMATVQIYATGFGPGQNTLIDVTQTQIADIGELSNKQGIQNLNAVYVADGSTLQQVEMIQNIKSDRITNERGLQRINNINIKNSKLNNVKILQDFRVSEASNLKGLQQLNLVSINNGKMVQGLTVIQSAKGRIWKNEEGVQSVNTIIQ